MWMDENFLEEPAHIDLADIEGEDEDILKIRTAMVNHPIDAQTIVVADPVDLETRLPAGPGERAYTFIGIEDSAFS